MILVAESPTRTLELDFREACEQLRSARAGRARKDTPAARRQVEECMTHVNAVLDQWNGSMGS